MHSSAGAATRGAALESTQVPAPVRVVLAEDDDEFRGLLSACLRRAGLEVVEARHGLELLGLVASGVLRSDGEALVELVISDVRLPGAPGLQALTALRRSDWNTPVILISSSTDPDLPLEASRLGVALLLFGPVGLEPLLLVVARDAPEEAEGTLGEPRALGAGHPSITSGRAGHALPFSAHGRGGSG